MEVIYQNNNGKIVHSDNIEAMKKIKENSVDSCISDFPYDLSFMGRKWDTTGNFYEWCKARAVELLRIMKSGGYVCIFGHPKTNHRMKSAFEDAGFNIVEEIDWVYLTGMPKNQDIGKLFDKKAGVERDIIGISNRHNSRPFGEGNGEDNIYGKFKGGIPLTTAPATNQAKIWDGWKTAGLKPAHEPITIFQKPREGTYIQNIEKYSCGGMNIDACRVGVREKQQFTGAKNGTINCYGDYFYEKSETPLPEGRFPPNLIIDEYIAGEFGEQTGITKSSGGKGEKSKGALGNNLYGKYANEEHGTNAGGLGDVGDGSRMFPIIKYCTKVSPKERLLPNGERNPHVTLKPVELIKWIIKLVTPIDGKTIDITAGSCTHAVACEELNKDEGYNLKWLNIEMMNTETEPYCNVGKMRVEVVHNNNIK